MNKVAIVSDSSAYIPKEYVDQYNLSIVPLTVNWQGKSYYDGVDIQATEFYQQLAESKEMATTSQVTVGQFLEVFTKLLDEGKDVFYMGISTGLSATCDSAVQAKKELGDPNFTSSNYLPMLPDFSKGYPTSAIISRNSHYRYLI